VLLGGTFNLEIYIQFKSSSGMTLKF